MSYRIVVAAIALLSGGASASAANDPPAARSIIAAQHKGVKILWGGDERASRQVYVDNLAVRLKSGGLGRATVSYTVDAVSYVGQDGNARFPDDRACFHNDIRRTLTWASRLTKPDGGVVDVRSGSAALPSLSGEKWSPVATCNDKIGEIRTKLERSTGSKRDWDREITDQGAEVRRILAEFGQVV